MRFLLDTGEGWATISAAFAHNYLGSRLIHGADMLRQDGQKSTLFVGPLAGEVGSLKFKTIDFYLVDHIGEADACLGAAFFLSYRVTIDPFRRVVLLENAR